MVLVVLELALVVLLADASLLKCWALFRVMASSTPQSDRQSMLTNITGDVDLLLIGFS